MGIFYIFILLKGMKEFFKIYFLTIDKGKKFRLRYYLVL